MLAFLAGLTDAASTSLPRDPPRRPALAGSMLEPDWAETGALAGWLGDRSSAWRITYGCGIRARPKRLRGRRRRAGPRHRHAPAEQLSSARPRPALALRRGGDGREPGHARVFTGAGFDVVRELQHVEVEVRSDRGDRDISGTGRAARPCCRRRLAAALLRAGERGRDRRFAPTRLDRRRALPQRARGRLRGRGLPGQPRREPVAGVRGYDSITEIPNPVELAVICLPGPQVLAAAEQALAKGVRAICVISSGFAETGEEGRERQSGCSRWYAPTARGCSGRTALGSLPPSRS